MRSFDSASRAVFRVSVNQQISQARASLPHQTKTGLESGPGLQSMIIKDLGFYSRADRVLDLVVA